MNRPLPDRRRTPMFRRGPSVGLRGALLLLLAAALLVAAPHYTPMETARQWIAVALKPLTWVAAIPDGLMNSWQRYVDRGSLEVDNRKLRDKQLMLDAQLSRMAALEAENGRLRGLLSSAAGLEQRVLIAEILQISQDPYRHQIVLNKGSNDGVYRGQALVDAHGVLGQVIQVNPTSCVALLITDPNHGIPVEINRTGLQTIALGRADGSGLSLPYLPGNADVKVGDLLVSSGLGGRFPAGYPVGEIHELRHAAGETFMEAIGYPSAQLNHGHEVLLVWSERPNAEPEPEPAPTPPPKSAGKSVGKPRR